MEKMLFMLSLALLFAAVVGQSDCYGSFEPTGGTWRAEWNVSSDFLYANFTVWATSNGWVGIGFSRDDMMPNTDMIIGAIDATGTVYSVTDRYAPDRTAPQVDEYQNITDISIERRTIDSQTYTIMSFTRPICSNNADDIALSEDPYILWAWGDVGNDGVTLMGHMSPENRGPSPMGFNFVCDGDQGSFMDTVAEIEWNISWEVSADATEARFEVLAQTMGWVAIGFSRNMMMANSDIIVGASNGVDMSYVSDRYASAQVPPAVDESQDITYESAQEMDIGGTLYTNVSFTRPTASNDPRDISLDDTPIYILLAWGMENNFDGSDPNSILQHASTRRTVLSNTYTFFTCGVILGPDDAAATTMAPTTAPTDAPTNGSVASTTEESSAAVSITTSLMLILVLITTAMMSI